MATSITKRLLKDPKMRKLMTTHDLTKEVVEMLIRARIRKGWTQAKLAKKMKTHQSVIARTEDAAYLPSLSLLDRMAKAYGSRLIAPRFAFMADYDPDSATMTEAEAAAILAESERQEAGETPASPAAPRASASKSGRPAAYREPGRHAPRLAAKTKTRAS